MFFVLKKGEKKGRMPVRPSPAHEIKALSTMPQTACDRFFCQSLCVRSLFLRAVHSPPILKGGQKKKSFGAKKVNVARRM